MEQSDATWDVAIIGAGPAGSTAAILLARAGRSVLLIEKKMFPRTKVCGGCLSGAAAAKVRQLLRGDSLPTVPGKGITFVMQNRRFTCGPGDATVLTLRSELDARLTEVAVAAGAKVRFGTEAKLIRGRDRWELGVGTERIQAATILIASGLSGLPRRIGIEGRQYGSPMFGQQWLEPFRSPLPPPGSVELHWLYGGYVGCATLDEQRCIIALATPLDINTSHHALAELRRLNPHAAIWDMLSTEVVPLTPAKGMVGFPWLPRTLGRDNVLLIGDAAGYVEPFTGEGIGQAMFSAECAVRALLDGGEVLRNYTAYMRPHRRRLWRTSLLSALLRWSSPHVSPQGAAPAWLDWIITRSVRAVHIGGSS